MRKKHQSFWLLSLAVITYWRYAIFNVIYPELCYLLCHLSQAMLFLCHIPRSSAIFFLNIMLQYIILTPRYANLSYAMFSGQSWGRILGYCCRINSIWSIRSDILESLVKKYSRERPGRKHCFTVKWVVLKPNHSYLENSATSD